MRQYLPVLTVVENKKGVLDVDTVKGCAAGMKKYPSGGCYGLCYASAIAKMYGTDFTKSVSRLVDGKGMESAKKKIAGHYASWYRVGTSGDPCHDWDHTVNVLEAIGAIKIPVVITKHWTTMSDDHAMRLMSIGVIVNTSTSPLDSDEEIDHRVGQFQRLKKIGVKSVLRVVSGRFGDTKQGKMWKNKQDKLMAHRPVIDNPLRIPKSDPRVMAGDILVTRIDGAVGGGSLYRCTMTGFTWGRADCARINAG